ncbi:MAG: dienelactone hydrolase family protein [Casimicrobiaceae bacterium]
MSDLRQYLIDEAVEDFDQGRLVRRDAIRMLGGLLGVALATQLIDARAQTAPPAPAPSVPPAPAVVPSPLRSAASVAHNDPAIVAASLRFPGGGDAQLTGYMARPNKPGTYPIVLVCHENMGLTRHNEDVTRRLAKAGYVGFAVDLLSREGGTTRQSPAAIPGMLGGVPPVRHVQDFQSALAFAKTQPFARPERAGMVGFCFGGGIAWRVAAAATELRAVVPFYGLPVSAAEVPNIQAAVLAIYAARDERIGATIPAIEAAMKENGKTFRKLIYPEVDHAFHDDTGDRYSAGAAQAAWEETLKWFAMHLQAA